MTKDSSAEVIDRLDFVKNRLVDLYKRNLVKINHSVMELVCAKHLIEFGYSVDVERRLTDILVCDVFATKGDGEAIVEIETGFTPPEHALDPTSYYVARIASKISRYSKHASKFVLATTPVSILPIPHLFRFPVRARRAEEIQKLKLVCDNYYKDPPIEVEDILNGRLHMIYIIDIDAGEIREMDVESYFEELQIASNLSRRVIEKF
ncbi:MAG TPA: hypothetical protein VE130_08320 [Nitrososphaeraceae archaeon]|jgi:hypothetical protein|nr:hypothetical protein [Nitrososphaeraceae archaeon]